MTDGSLRVISMAEVEKHNYQNEPRTCWVVIEGKVYDVTQFLQEHPGGEEVITDVAGKDATVGFLDVGHSKDAREMTKDYLIGVLLQDDAATSAAEKAEEKSTVGGPGIGAQISDIIFSPTWTNFLIPTAIGIAVYFLYKAAIRVMG